jgi:hypothetical protein
MRKLVLVRRRGLVLRGARVARFRVDRIYIIEEPLKPANKAWFTDSFLAPM